MRTGCIERGGADHRLAVGIVGRVRGDAVNGNDDRVRVLGAPVDSRAAAGHTGIGIRVEVLNGRVDRLLAVLRARGRGRGGGAALDADLAPDRGAEVHVVGAAHLPITAVGAVAVRGDHIDGDINRLARGDIGRDVDVAAAHLVAGDIHEGVRRGPSAGTVVIDTPSLRESLTRFDLMAVGDGNILDEGHRVDAGGRRGGRDDHGSARGSGRRGDLTRARDRSDNGGVIRLEEAVRDRLGGAVLNHIGQVAVDDGGQRGVLAAAEGVVLFRHIAVVGSVLAGLGVEIFIDILIHQHGINVAAIQRGHGVGDLGIGVDVAGADDAAVHQIRADPLLEARTFFNAEFGVAESFVAGRRGGLARFGYEQRGAVVINAGEVNAFRPFIVLRQRAADDIHLADFEGVNQAVEGDIRILQADAHTAGNFLHQGNIDAGHFAGLIVISERNIIRGRTEIQHPRSLNVRQVIGVSSRERERADHHDNKQ